MSLSNAPNIIYLEAYIESTTALPPELQRILNTIKALDEKCADLTEVMGQSVSQLLSMAPHHQQSSVSEEYIQACQRVEHVKALLLQFAEEKVQLSQQAYDLVEMHALQLEQTIDDFESDLRAQGMLDGSSNPLLNDLYIPSLLETPRGRTPKLEEQWPLPTPIERLDSSLPGFGLVSAANLPVVAPPQQPPPPPLPPPQPLPQPLQLKKHLQNAAQKGKRQRDEDGSSLYKKQKHTSTAFLSGMPSFDDGLYAQPTFEQEVQVGFLNPPPAGFKASAPMPQAPGRYLYHHDITPDLKGRHAELFWPDDSLWYLIEIQDVDVAKKTAQIVYTTGEVEELNLDEIASDMHMIIIPLDLG